MIIEFIGTQGVGKTTKSIELLKLLREQGLSVTHNLELNKKYSPKIKKILRAPHAIFHFRSLFTKIFVQSIFSKKSVKHLINSISQLILETDCVELKNTHVIFDESFLSKHWTLFRKKPNNTKEYLVNLFSPNERIVVYLETDLERNLKQVQSRNNKLANKKFVDKNLLKSKNPEEILKEQRKVVYENYKFLKACGYKTIKMKSENSLKETDILKKLGDLK